MIPQQSPWMNMDPQKAARIRALLAQNGQPGSGFYPPGQTGGAQVPSSVPPSFLPGAQAPAPMQPGQPYRDIANPAGPAPGAAQRPPPTLVPRGTPPKKPESDATNQTQYSGADQAMTGPSASPGLTIPGMPSAWLGVLTPGMKGSPATGGQESTPKSPLQAAGLRPPTQSFAPVTIAKDALSGAMPELSDTQHLNPDGSIKAVPMFTGQQSSSEGSVEGGMTNESHQVEAISDPEYLKSYNRMIAGTPGLDMQRADVSNLRKGVGALAALEMRRTPIGRIDLSPAMALTDSWTGSNLLPGYHGPQTYLAPLAGLVKTLSESEGNLAGGERNMMFGNLLDYFNGGANLKGTGERKAGSGGMPINPLEIARFGAEQQQRSVVNARDVAKETGNLIDKMPDARIVSSLQTIDAMAKKYKGELPGYYGSAKAGVQGMTPTMGLGLQYFNDPQKREDALALRQAISTIQNATTHAEFGSRQTQTEIGNGQREIGVGLTTGPEALLRGLSHYQSAIQRHASSMLNSADEPTRAKYNQTGGVQPSELNFDFGLGSKGRAAAPAAGGGKTVTKKEYSPSRKQTRVTYSDGSTEVLDGRK